jgi:hypothetical protein
MSEHKAPSTRRLRAVGRKGAIVAGGVLAISAFAVGTASAAEGYGMTDGGTATGSSFGPTTPVDAVAQHWMTYHYGKDITSEPQTIMADPQYYTQIHEEMVKAMLGQGSAAGMNH